jgi:N-acetyl-anhydromuramyl-L-alanine amidase AmpD
MTYAKTYRTIKKSWGTNAKEYILLHHTGSTAPAENNARFLAWNPIQASCHYVVGELGEIFKIGKDDDILWHAGKSSWDGKTNLNKCSIGIEINSDGSKFTDIQRASVKELIKDLMKKYNIPAKNVIRHRDASPDRKWDVGNNFWNNEYKSYSDYQKSLEIIPPSMTETETLAKMLWVAADEFKKKCSDIQEQMVEIQGQAHEIAERARNV